MKKVIALVLTSLSFFTFADSKPSASANKEKEKMSPEKIKAIADKALKTGVSTTKENTRDDTPPGDQFMHGDDRY